MTPTGYTEDSLVEQPAITLLSELGWETVNAYCEFDHGTSTMGRETRAEVILTARLRPALQRLNPEAPPEAIDQAIEELTRDRSRMSMAAANREIYPLLKNGVRVPVPDPEGDGESVEVIRVMDWDDPANNDFLLCSQFWITGEMHTRRADIRKREGKLGVFWHIQVSGLIVDYAGVFRNLERALAIYGAGGGGDKPVEDKAALVAALRQALGDTRGLCQEQGVNLTAIQIAGGFSRVGLLDDAVEALVTSEEIKRRYIDLSNN